MCTGDRHFSLFCKLLCLHERRITQRYQPTVVGQVSLGVETDVSEESSYVIVVVPDMRGTRLAELPTIMYVSGQSYETVPEIRQPSKRSS